MLPKKNRVDKKTIERIFKEGKFLNSPLLTFKFIQNIGHIPRFSFLTPKSVSKSAVKRNLLRRRGYSALKRYFKDFPANLNGVFIFKKYQDEIPILENEIETILHKLN